MAVGVLAAHQPDLLPYSGFWAKMWQADVFDLAVHDQFQHPGYQNRVLMRGSWLTLPVEKSEHGKPIMEVRIDGTEWADRLIDGVFGRYGGSRFHKPIASWLALAAEEAGAGCGGRMWLFNLSLLLAVRDRLGIRTPLGVGARPVGFDATERLIDLCRQYRAQAYLSGPGGRAYLDVERFEAAVELRWLTHVPPSEDSVVSLLMDEKEPMRAVIG